jgi:RNA polymerase sigma-70 factor (ECF subfamily)
MTTGLQLFVAMRQASIRASLLVRTAGFPPDELQDLQQELLLDCVRRAPKFDPARGGWGGFVRGVMCNHSAVLVMRRCRRTLELCSEDLPTSEEADEAESLDALDSRTALTIEAATLLTIDVRRVVKTLPEQLQSLAAMLSEMPIHRVCQRTRKSRSRIYQMIRQLRGAFVGAGYQPSRDRQITNRSRRVA